MAFFSISGLDAGHYVLYVTYLGYDSISVDINLAKDQILYERIYLSEKAVDLGIINVSARKEKARSDVQVSKITVTPKQIRALPSTGGEADIAQYLPVLPGIVYSGDQGGQLYIRGGSPIQNKILLDGMTIYNPFHSIGFFSVFETETLRNVDVYTGGFSAEYGGRISAIVDLKTRDGNKKRFGGVVSVNPFQSKVLVEGPIKRLNEETGGSTSFLLTGKHSYIDQTSKVLYEYAADSVGLPYSFTDLYGKLSFSAGNGSKLDVFGFNFDDEVQFQNIADLDWQAQGGGAQFKLIPPRSPMVMNGRVSYSKYNISLDERNDAPRASEIKGFNAGLDFTYFGKTSELKYGFQLDGLRTNFQFENFLGHLFEQFENTTELGGFVLLKQKLGKFIIEPSVRLQYYASLSDFSFEPRLGVKYNATDNVRLKFAGGTYSQNLISSVNEQDIVNLFVGFISAPQKQIFKPGTTEQVDHKLQKSFQGVLGTEIDLTDNLELNLEGYYKGFTQLININRNKLIATDPDYATETGEAYGLDLSLRYETGPVYFWATYSLGYVNRDDGEQLYPTVFDRRHNVNLLATYAFGDKTWEASARWNMGSGFPFTLTQGFHSFYTFEDGINSDVLTGNPDLGIIYSDDRNSGRLPYYHRLDVSLKKKIVFNRHTSLDIVASVTNVYDRKNIFYFDRIRYERVDQLPILPSLGLILNL